MRINFGAVLRIVLKPFSPPSHEILEFRPVAIFTKTNISFQNLYSKIFIG
jgi:hypothetical protein